MWLVEDSYRDLVNLRFIDNSLLPRNTLKIIGATEAVR
jgi:hypothetical protein